MTKRTLAICLLLSLLTLGPGCSDVMVEPSRPQAEPVARAEASDAPQEAETVEAAPSEPNVLEPNRVEPETETAITASAEITEPNDPGDIPPETIPVEEPAIEPNVVAATEPNEMQIQPADVNAAPPAQEPSEPNSIPPGEPNEPVVVVEPNEPEPQIEGQAAALPSFVERYADVLQNYVRQDGRVDYGSLRRRRLELKRLLMKLGDLDPGIYAEWPKETKLAFWINAYNLKMLETITRNYPVESSWWLRLTWPPSDIRHIKGIWTDYKFIVTEEEFTLSEVERRFFRETFGDPRAYLAITYATRSSPRLRRELYVGDRLDQQLQEQVAEFLADPKGFQIDQQKKVVYLSALFKPSWRGKEFVARYGTAKKFKEREPETRAVLNFITGYLSREDAYFLEVENYTIEYVNFDWRINDTAKGY